ncbi:MULTISPECIES: ComF family protein [Aerosakkonema]|uniref:ComF family protein n=1 Tax=Aerosakkonema TaxID=1246629 RepID=UPI0035BA80D5
MSNWTAKVKGLLNLFLQSTCPICQRPTPKQFCQDCHRQLERCQMSKPDKFWRGELPIFAWGVYGGALKRALKVLKYEKKLEIAEPLGHWLGEAWLKSALAGSTKLTVVPIPLHANKQRQRGYNQAELLAESFCEVAGLPIERYGLERVRDTKPQFGLSAVERKQNVAGAFELGKGFSQRRPASAILLLDDIYTTGDTARSAAHTLHQHRIRIYGIAAIATPGPNNSFDRTKLET